jgi:hypothetical protein
MRLKYIFLSLIIFSLILSTPVNAFNDTSVIERVTMYIHGNAYYLNNMPLPAGTVLIAKDQFGTQLGKYIIRESGKIGNSYGYQDNFEIGVWKNQSDKTNRTRNIIILITSTDGSPARNTLTFTQNDNLQYDIVLNALPPTPTPLPTTIPTPTTKPTTIPQTTNVTTISSTPIPTPTPSPGPSSNDYIYYGVLATIVIISALVISGILISWLMSKTSRDDILHPGENWKDK